MKNLNKIFIKLTISTLLIVQFIPLNLVASAEKSFDNYTEYNEAVNSLLHEGRESEVPDLKLQPIVENQSNKKENQQIKKITDDQLPVIDFSEFELMEGNENIIEINKVSKDKPLLKFNTEKKKTGKKGLGRFTLDGMKKEKLEKPPSLSDLLGIQTAYASFANPIINYYPGLEYNNMDLLLYYISSIQSDDGSFGKFNKYEHTYNILIYLDRFNLINNDQYTAALQYLINTEPQNNREKAKKANIMFNEGLNYQQYLDELVLAQTNTGIGYFDEYAGDPITSIESALALLYANDYDHTTMANLLAIVTYAINPDGSINYTQTGDSSFYLANYIVQRLYMFDYLTVNDQGQNIVIQDKIDEILAYIDTNFDLIKSEMDKIMTLKTYKLYDIHLDRQKELREYLYKYQHIDGSFGDSLHTSIEAMEALAEPDLVLISITAQNPLVNKGPQTISIGIENRGYATTRAPVLYTFIDNMKLAYQGDLHAANHILGPGESTVMEYEFTDDLTSSFISDTEFKFYVEDTFESNYENNWIEETFTFAPDPDGKPAMLVWDIAHAYGEFHDAPGLNVRWDNKDDPNRMNYAVLMRIKGDPLWNRYYIWNDWNGFFVSGLQEGETYEVKLGVVETTATWPWPAYYTEHTHELTVSADDTLYVGNLNGYVTENNERLEGIPIYGYSIAQETQEGGSFELVDYANGTTAAWVDSVGYDPIKTAFYIDTGQTYDNVRLFTRLLPDTDPPTITEFRVQARSNFVLRNDDTVDILAFADDNIGVKEGDFYYWDPVEQIWIFIGTEEFINSGEGHHFWYVPDTFLGTGYKLKVIVRDFAGNESLPTEWGPFEIVDGSLPTFEVIDPNGGENWELGSTQDVNYEAVSANGISEIDIFLKHPNSDTDIALDTANTGTFSYNVPDDYNYVSSDYTIYIEGEDDVTALVSSDESDAIFSITDPSPVPDAPWDDPYLISDSITYNLTNGGVGKPIIEYGNNGIAHIFYTNSENHGFADDIIQIYYMTYNSANGTTSTPVMIYELVTTDNSELGDLRDLDVAIDSNNNPHLVWTARTNIGSLCEVRNAQEVYYMYHNGSNWVNPINISNNTTWSATPDIVSDNSGNIHVVWKDGLTYTGCTGSGNIQVLYNMKNSSGTWLGLSTFGGGENPSYPKVAVNSSVYSVYKSADGGYDFCEKTSGWYCISDFIGGTPEDVQIIAGTGDTLHTVYVEGLSGPDRSSVMYKYYDGSNWTAPVEISDPIADVLSNNPQITIDENNISHVSYEFIDNNISNKRFLYWTTKFAGNWIAPQRENRLSQHIQENSSDLAYGGNNKLTSVWQLRSEFVYHVMINNADLSAFSPSYPPTFSFIEPDGTDDNAKNSFNITWTDDDPDSNAEIRLYYDTDNSGADGMFINFSNIFEDDITDSHNWDTSGIPEGIYYLYAVIDDNDHNPVTVYSQNPVTVSHHTVYEDAENLNEDGWVIYDNNPAGANVTNVYDSTLDSRVIELSGTALLNGFRLFLDNYNPWNNTEEFIAQWDQKFGSEYYVYFDVQTTNGHYYIYYNSSDTDNLGSGTSVHHGLGSDSANNQWQTITRNLQEDLHDAQPGVDISSVNSILMRGNGRVDNIQLLRNLGSEINNDTDGDGLTDSEEIHTYNTNHELEDTDNDGLTDYEEVITYGTDPRNIDSDNDGATDSAEITAGTDPNDDQSYPTGTVYEDAEDANTDGWTVFDDNPAWANVSNVYDISQGSRVIVLTGQGLNNGYRLQTANNTPWENNQEVVISWDQKFSANYYVYIEVQTTGGKYYLYYSPIDNDVLGSGGAIHHGLGSDKTDNQWHTITRDLEADLQDVYPGLDITSINSFAIRGSGRLDNIMLLREMNPSLDSDSDGLIDVDEINVYGTNPNIADSDGDGLSDYDEILTHSTNPNSVDSDGDGFDDNIEISAGTDPLNNASFPSETIYEDAEDSTYDGWTIFDDNPSFANIVNQYDGTKGSRVIVLNGQSLNNGFQLNKEDGQLWNNSSQFIMQWDQKFASNHIIYVPVQTTSGNYYLYYSPVDNDILGNSTAIHHGLGSDKTDSQWHTITRDLQADLHDAYPNIDIVSVKNMLVRGAGRFDNIKLMQ